MADHKPINWAYPFKTAGEDSKEVNDPQLFLDALAKAKDGFYPMGANGLWHGGVHFDAGTGRAMEEETESYAALIEEAERGPILSKLYEIIDQPDEKGVRDNKLTPEEFQAALGKPWLAQQLSLLISQHEGEWFWSESKWNQLDKLMEHTLEEPNLQWVREKERIKTLSWWKELAGQFPLDGGGNAWHINLVSIVSNFIGRRGCNCKADVKVTRWKSKSTGNIYYGPVHWGANRLSQAAQWSELISAGYVTEDDKEIICVMTENEGKIEAVQSYDSEIITAGAMQKIISIDGVGEFPKQVNKIKELHPDLYVEFFESQGWYLDSASVSPKMFYQHGDWKGGVRLEGEDLKSSLREGCSEDTVGKTIDCPPVSSIACAISSPEYVKLQIIDYIDRLRSALSKKPTGYAYSANELFKSKLGRGLVLEHDINKPAFVADDLKAAIDKFHLNNPKVSEDISSWGGAHAENEQKIIEYYGPERRMTEANKRCENLKLEL